MNRPTTTAMINPTQSNGSMVFAMNRWYKKIEAGRRAMSQNIQLGKPDFSEYWGWRFIDFKDSTAR